MKHFHITLVGFMLVGCAVEIPQSTIKVVAQDAGNNTSDDNKSEGKKVAVSNVVAENPTLQDSGSNVADASINTTCAPSVGSCAWQDPTVRNTEMCYESPNSQDAMDCGYQTGGGAKWSANAPCSHQDAVLKCRHDNCRTVFYYSFITPQNAEKDCLAKGGTVIH